MKNILKYIPLALATLVVFVSCKREVEPLPFYETGAGTDLTLSTSTVTLNAANAGQNVVTFSWGDPKFATDTANYKYVVEIAPKGTNFANPRIITKIGGINGSSAITGNELNSALVAWGIPYGTTTDLDVRLKSSYANNNDMKLSAVQTLRANAFAAPFTLTASATGPFQPTPQTKDNILTKLSWNAPSLSSSTFSYVLEYAKSGTNFAVPTTISFAADSMQKSLTAMDIFQMANTAAIALNTTGSVDVRVKATVNGTGQVSYSNTQALQISPIEMTLYMYMPGDYQGWSPATAPRLASPDGIKYEGYVWVRAGGTGEFKINAEPDWDHNSTSYGGTSTASGGTLDASGGNLKWPATGKYYLVNVDMNAKTWAVTEITTWGVIGDATPAGWGGSTPLTYNATTNKWMATIVFGSGQFKFRANNDWGINLGSQGGDGTSIQPLKAGGGNLPAPTAGPHIVTLDLSNPLKYTYTIQ